MSTQRREDRWQRRSCKERDGELWPSGRTSAARYACAHATVGTAPPLQRNQSRRTSKGNREVAFFLRKSHPDCLQQGYVDSGSAQATARLATNSLQSDYRITQIVRLVHCVRLAPSGIRHSSQNCYSSPPPGAGRHANLGTPATPWSSPLAHPLPFRVPASLPGLAVIPAG
jgi:hypothetical protein